MHFHQMKTCKLDFIDSAKIRWGFQPNNITFVTTEVRSHHRCFSIDESHLQRTLLPIDKSVLSPFLNDVSHLSKMSQKHILSNAPPLHQLCRRRGYED